MTVEEVPICRRKEIIRDCFADDEIFLEKYHENAGMGLTSCVDRTFKYFNSLGKFTMYAIKKGKEIVAYFGKEINNGLCIMTGFLIKTKYRTKEFILYFWEVVKSKMNTDDVFTAVFKNNDKAISFLSKKGTVCAESDDALMFKIL